jgi:hypothetical protein
MFFYAMDFKDFYFHVEDPNNNLCLCREMKSSQELNCLAISNVLYAYLSINQMKIKILFRMRKCWKEQKRYDCWLAYLLNSTNFKLWIQSHMQGNINCCQKWHRFGGCLDCQWRCRRTDICGSSGGRRISSDFPSSRVTLPTPTRTRNIRRMLFESGLTNCWNKLISL